MLKKFFNIFIVLLLILSIVSCNINNSDTDLFSETMSNSTRRIIRLIENRMTYDNVTAAIFYILKSDNPNQEATVEGLYNSWQVCHFGYIVEKNGSLSSSNYLKLDESLWQNYYHILPIPEKDLSYVVIRTESVNQVLYEGGTSKT